MTASRDIYVQKALESVGRLLTTLDRNPFSKTYGSFHRDYWHDKGIDFSDADRQYGIHALALLYKFDFPGSAFKGQPKIRDWVIAALVFWTRRQHSDGSYDEHYPYERGWVGGTAFSTYTACEAYSLLAGEIPPGTAQLVRAAIHKSASYIARGQSEEDHLANHHALACLTVWKAYEVLKDEALKKGYELLLEGFLRYHNSKEGWSREYDGADPGYLTETISFLAKIYETNPDPRIKDVLNSSIEFVSHFMYPDGYFGGAIGSRNTQHAYPHGFEVMAKTNPLAAAIAEKMLISLGEGKLVPPETMSDHYFAYRLPEYLLAYQAYSPRPVNLVPLPYEREPFITYFADARIHIINRKNIYAVANPGKGGVVKVFDKAKKILILNDSGMIGRLADERLMTSQWICPDYKIETNDSTWSVEGRFQTAPAQKRFTLLTNVLFRITLLLFGWNATFSHGLKGLLRKTLILGSKPMPATFKRTFQLDEKTIRVADDIRLEGRAQVKKLSVGDEFQVRHVPQSRYFQLHELAQQAYLLTPDELKKLNQDRCLTLTRTFDLN